MKSDGRLLLTRHDHLHQVALAYVLGGGDSLQDVFRVHVMAEEQDFVVHPQETAFWELTWKKRNTQCYYKHTSETFFE